MAAHFKPQSKPYWAAASSGGPSGAAAMRSAMAAEAEAAEVGEGSSGVPYASTTSTATASSSSSRAVAGSSNEGGLQNLGNSCYMNSVVQVRLCYIL